MGNVRPASGPQEREDTALFTTTRHCLWEPWRYLTVACGVMVGLLALLGNIGASLMPLIASPLGFVIGGLYIAAVMLVVVFSCFAPVFQWANIHRERIAYSLMVTRTHVLSSAVDEKDGESVLIADIAIARHRPCLPCTWTQIYLKGRDGLRQKLSYRCWGCIYHDGPQGCLHGSKSSCCSDNSPPDLTIGPCLRNPGGILEAVGYAMANSPSGSPLRAGMGKDISSVAPHRTIAVEVIDDDRWDGHGLRGARAQAMGRA